MVVYENENEPINPNDGEGALVWILISGVISIVLIFKLLQWYTHLS